MINDMEYRTKTYTIKFSNNGHKFVEQISTIMLASNDIVGTITLSQGHNVVSGKSLLDIYSLRFEKPVLLIVQGEISDKYLQTFASWEDKGDENCQ